MRGRTGQVESIAGAMEDGVCAVITCCCPPRAYLVAPLYAKVQGMRTWASDSLKPEAIFPSHFLPPTDRSSWPSESLRLRLTAMRMTCPRLGTSGGKGTRGGGGRSRRAQAHAWGTQGGTHVLLDVAPFLGPLLLGGLLLLLLLLSLLLPLHLELLRCHGITWLRDTLIKAWRVAEAVAEALGEVRARVMRLRRDEAGLEAVRIGLLRFAWGGRRGDGARCAAGSGAHRTHDARARLEPLLSQVGPNAAHRAHRLEEADARELDRQLGHDSTGGEVLVLDILPPDELDRHEPLFLGLLAVLGRFLSILGRIPTSGALGRLASARHLHGLLA
eukprot:scaffold193440_cov26-Tisochrysis_lutea.AAC.4